MHLLIISLLLFQGLDASLVESLGDASFRKREAAYSALKFKLSLTDGFSQKETLDVVKSAMRHSNTEITWRAGRLYDESRNKFFNDKNQFGIIAPTVTSAARDVYHRLIKLGYQVEYFRINDRLHLVTGSKKELTPQDIDALRKIFKDCLIVPASEPYGVLSKWAFASN